VSERTRRSITKGLQIKKIAVDDEIGDGVISSEEEEEEGEGEDEVEGRVNVGVEDSDSLGRISQNKTSNNEVPIKGKCCKKLKKLSKSELLS